MIGPTGMLMLEGVLLAKGTRLDWLGFGIRDHAVDQHYRASSKLDTHANQHGVRALLEVSRVIGQQLHGAGWTELRLAFERTSGARWEEVARRDIVYRLDAAGARQLRPVGRL
jgi:hypothetical protein